VTRRLYYDDSYLREFTAHITAIEGERVYLDRTAFYPTSGGQPFDTGTIDGLAVGEVIDEGDAVAHLLVGSPKREGEVACVIDWGRRFDHMQQHTGQHLLSGVLHGEYGIETVSFHLGSEASTIDLSTASIAEPALAEMEGRINEVICENRPVTVSYHEDGAGAGLRKASMREGTLRVVSIDGLDRSACGGTHVRATGEIGAVLLGKLEKVRGNVRLEFFCGARAVKRARTAADVLNRIARVYSSTWMEVPGLVAAQAERLAESEKQRQKLAVELAESRGRQLHAGTVASAGGLRLHRRDGRVADEELRAEASAFASCGRAVFIAADRESGALLLAVSSDAEVKAGAALQAAVAKFGGRGGGGATLAQGRVPVEQVAAAMAEIERVFE
jgi:alanyl-tRNA synthetase